MWVSWTQVAAVRVGEGPDPGSRVPEGWVGQSHCRWEGPQNPSVTQHTGCPVWTQSRPSGNIQELGQHHLEEATMSDVNILVRAERPTCDGPAAASPADGGPGAPGSPSKGQAESPPDPQLHSQAPAQEHRKQRPHGDPHTRVPAHNSPQKRATDRRGPGRVVGTQNGILLSREKGCGLDTW